MSEFDLAYRRYFPVIRAKCRRMLVDSASADDVAQETFMKLWKSRFLNADPRTQAAWVYRTSTRIAIDQLRERARRPGEGVADEVASAAPRPDDALAMRQILEKLAAVLPRRELEIALLHRLDELTQEEIATVAQVSARTVRRCLERLDQRLATLGKEIMR